MQLKNTTSFDMAQFLLLLDEQHIDLPHLLKFRKLWPVLYYTVRVHKQHIKENKINRLRLNRQKLALKIIEIKASDENDAIKNRKIAQLQSYIRNINSALQPLLTR